MKSNNIQSFYWENNIFFRLLLSYDSKYLLRFWLLLIIWYVIALIICAIEGTISIPGPNIGYIEDKPFLVLYFVLPIIINTLGGLLSRFESFLEELPHLVKDAHPTSAKYNQSEILKNKITEIKNFISLKDKRSHKYYKFLLGAWILLVIIFQLILPILWPQNPVAWTIDPNEYPLGFSFGILWALFVYVVVVGNAMWYGLTIAIKVFSLVNQYARENKLIVNLFSYNDEGGIALLGKLQLSLIKMMSSGFLFIFAWFWLYGLNIALLCGMIIFILVLLTAFFAPMIIIHKDMKHIKLIETSQLSRLFINFYQNNSVPGIDIKLSGQNYTDINSFDDLIILTNIVQLYNQISAMPVWPLNIKTLRKFITIIILPLIFAIFQMAIYAEYISEWIKKILH